VGTSVGMFCAKLIAASDNTCGAFNKLTRMDRLLPEKYYIKFFLGLAHISLQNPQKAMEFLEEALKLDPKGEDVPSIYCYMGICLRDMEQYRKAISVLEKGAEIDSERTDIHNLMGFCYFKLKEHVKAIEAFHKVLELNPASAIDYANIASNYRDMGNRDMAIRFYKFALELDESIDFARDSLRRLEKKEHDRSKHLTKFFGDKLAVDDISFSVERGEVLGFLGPNAAGKSTTMRMITGFLPPTSGTATIGGSDIINDSLNARKKIGYLPENAPAYPDMTVTGFLEFIAGIRGFSGDRKIAGGRNH
jgi:tetratricopeptide (TPR) repeat protein